MRYEYLGIDPKSKLHTRIPLTHAESVFLGLLWVDHVGRENVIPADALAELFAARMHLSEGLERVKREIRHLQNHLIIRHDIPVYSASGIGGGYWMGEESDAAGFFESFRERGLTGLTKASRGKKSAMVDMVMQLSFRWRDLVEKAGVAGAEDDGGVDAPIQVVDAFLHQILKDPQKYSRGLKLLGEKYGSVLVPREVYEQTVGAIRRQAEALAELAGRLEG